MTNITGKRVPKPRARSPIKVIVERKFVGDRTIAEAFIPVITEDIRHKAGQPRTFDNKDDSS